MNDKEYWETMRHYSPCSQPVYINNLPYAFEKLAKGSYPNRGRDESSTMFENESIQGPRDDQVDDCESFLEN